MPSSKWIRASSEEAKRARNRRPARLCTRQGRCRLVAGATTAGGAASYSVRTGCAMSTSQGDTLTPLLPDGEKARGAGFRPSPRQSPLRAHCRQAARVACGRGRTECGRRSLRRRGLVSHAGEGRRAEGRYALPVIRIMDRFVLAVKECVYQGCPRKYAVLVELGESKAVPEDVADRRKALKEFINGFVPSALETQGCSWKCPSPLGATFGVCWADFLRGDRDRNRTRVTHFPGESVNLPDVRPCVRVA
ncbi:hypothetical protein SAMN02745898_10876 [Streptomyces sp. 136MFCol5.1]|nr:hypothetical protein SAMN02745898_10876 [Streptomyces sp. 136MFCol5.1]SFT18358.1 hypothetical protein SAMN04487982_10979 [Streptomyces sp. ok210]